MVRHANLIEEIVQLANDRSDLLGQVAGVHGCKQDGGASTRVSERSFLKR